MHVSDALYRISRFRIIKDPPLYVVEGLITSGFGIFAAEEFANGRYVNALISGGFGLLTAYLTIRDVISYHSSNSQPAKT